MSKKNRRLESLFLLSKIISTSADKNEIKQDILSGIIDWMTVVEIANTHYLTAALYYSLLDKDLIKYINDEDLLNYLEQIYTINLHRNQKIVKQSKEMNNILSKQNIKPVFLKGSASLLQNDYLNVGMRFLTDIDFCIFDKDFQKAKESLLSFGYVPQTTEGRNIETHHHWWPMNHVSWDTQIELHKRILAGSYSHFIECNEANVQNSDHYSNLTILTPTFRMIHAYIHSDIIDRTNVHKLINLRQLYEQSIIIEKYKNQIDWQYIEKVFKKHKILKTFNYNLMLINDLFGIRAQILKYNLFSRMNQKILYKLFQNSSLSRAYITLRHIFIYRTESNFCEILTKKDFIYCLVKSFQRGFKNWREGKYKP